MRLDKFLKVSRLIKRRTVAKEVCDAGRVLVNGRPAKAGAEVKPGDLITLGFGAKQLQVEVIALAENVRADRAQELYRVR
ncbi:MAG: RNA-binding S4 domain-containing protein [Syntrophomonadaceae bacterium]|nr:RNA-binding S4 domain-containing protein [Syntrophomonadaceae bacterium]